MDKLAEGLQKLGEDDLLQVVQMVHDNKTADSYTKNDVEREYLPSSATFKSIHGG
jgi:transcription initiation factor TFIID/TFIIF subunit